MVQFTERVLAFYLAALATVCACCITAYSVWQHVDAGHRARDEINAEIRRDTIRILILVPLYACESFFDLFFHHYPGGSVFREAYESIVILSLYRLLVSLLGGPDQLQAILHKQYSAARYGDADGFQQRYQHVPQCMNSFLRPIKTPDDFVWFTKTGILQYVPIKICGAIVMFVCEQFGVWRAGTFTVMSAQFWTANITSLSQMLAIYALLMFWRAFMVELEPYRTGLKLICVKGVVFFSWWQSLGVAFAVNQGWIVGSATTAGGSTGYTTEQAALGVQDFLICIEMLGFAVLHIYAFPPSESVVQPDREPETHKSAQLLTSPTLAQNLTGLGKQVMTALNVHDIVADLDQTLLPQQSNNAQPSSVVNVPSELEFGTLKSQVLLSGHNLDSNNSKGGMERLFADDALQTPIRALHAVFAADEETAAAPTPARYNFHKADRR